MTNNYTGSKIKALEALKEFIDCGELEIYSLDTETVYTDKSTLYDIREKLSATNFVDVIDRRDA